jgi:hypothetical protein
MDNNPNLAFLFERLSGHYLPDITFTRCTSAIRFPWQEFRITGQYIDAFLRPARIQDGRARIAHNDDTRIGYVVLSSLGVYHEKQLVAIETADRGVEVTTQTICLPGFPDSNHLSLSFYEGGFRKNGKKEGVRTYDELELFTAVVKNLSGIRSQDAAK